jgi:hypothetical protein
MLQPPDDLAADVLAPARFPPVGRPTSILPMRNPFTKCWCSPLLDCSTAYVRPRGKRFGFGAAKNSTDLSGDSMSIRTLRLRFLARP